MDSCTLEMMVVGVKDGWGLSYCSELEVSSTYTTSVCTCLHLFTVYLGLYLLFFWGSPLVELNCLKGRESSS